MLWRHDNLQRLALLCNFWGEAHTFHCSRIMCLLEIISALIKAFYPDYDYFINYSCGLKPRWQLSSKLSVPKLIVKPKPPTHSLLFFSSSLLSWKSPQIELKNPLFAKQNINIFDNTFCSDICFHFHVFSLCPLKLRAVFLVLIPRRFC